MRNDYLGSISSREHDLPARWPGSEEGHAAKVQQWKCTHAQGELFLQVDGTHFRLFRFARAALLLRGYVTYPSAGHLPDQDRVAESLHRHYQLHGELPVERLEGSFTLALLDGRRGRVILYRNLVGNGFTYYTETADGLLFGSNLASLMDASGRPARPNRDSIPAYFLYRFVPGRETLFAGAYRLLPGEMLIWDAGLGLTRRQEQTLGGRSAARASGRRAVDEVEEALGRIVADCAALRPGAANLLSGGVDSTYLQSLWNRLVAGGPRPVSFSLSVNHPRTQANTDYALSAAERLKTRHTLVPADGPYIGYLLDAIAATGEPPNHVQAAYFGHLARVMAGRGFSTGLCGEGADNQFGLPAANRLQYAGVLRALLPCAPLRRAAGRVARSLGWQWLSECLSLAQHLHDWHELSHPVNQVSAFTDWDAVQVCFGRRGVEAAAAYRRELLDRLAAPDDPLGRTHAVGFLGDAVDSAALWTALFNDAGADLLCPFLDSRLVRLVANLPRRDRYPFRRPKGLLRRALARHVPSALAYRPKLGFGQPIFEWMAAGGQLRPWVERIGEYEFVDRATLARVLARPTWFLYSLLCYDLWHRLFIDRSMPRRAAPAPAARGEPALALA